MITPAHSTKTYHDPNSPISLNLFIENITHRGREQDDFGLEEDATGCPEASTCILVFSGHVFVN
jgi:hypothetical protein